ncbi:hypothetical protein MBLL_01804 (plasmid) [Methylobacterium bullatum]|uniref:Uncharacterized protein n=1 Tax=Methylobacterium bullatum TaxID=570505 RepID=A0A679K751_9HYPH|nr:hypothetical protein MBLL_01804 [Methylobacterium bullatum]
MRRDGLPLLEGEGWGEVWSASEKVTHLNLSLSFQKTGPAHPARCVNAVVLQETGLVLPVRCLNIVALRQGGIVGAQREIPPEMLGDQPAERAESDDPDGDA